MEYWDERLGSYTPFSHAHTTFLKFTPLKCKMKTKTSSSNGPRRPVPKFVSRSQETKTPQQNKVFVMNLHNSNCGEDACCLNLI